MLPPPAIYVPFESGIYDVRPGLRPMSHDFGNGEADVRIFQIDSQFVDFRNAKLDARRENFRRHVLQDDGYEQIAGAVARFIIERLVAEHPQHFTLVQNDARQRLECRLTGERLCFDADWRLLPHETDSVVCPTYTSAFDALTCQVQEEFAVTRADATRNWIAALHVCLPSHWRPETKLGQDFATVHAPVPGMEPFTAIQDKFVTKMLSATHGLVRFVWGLQWNNHLNRHPDRSDSEVGFDPEFPNAWVRVERQTLWGLPESKVSLFTIRPYLTDARDVKSNPAHASALATAIRSMPEASLRYKGLYDNRDRFLAWLEAVEPAGDAGQVS